MEFVRGLAAAQYARDRDSGPDPFAYPPGTIFCDGCGYRVPEDDCTALFGKQYCEDCIGAASDDYIEEYARNFVLDSVDTYREFLGWFFQEIFHCKVFGTDEEYGWIDRLFLTLTEEEQDEYMERFAARMGSGFRDWIYWESCAST